MTRAAFATIALAAFALFLAFAGDKLAGPNVISEPAQLARWDAELAIAELTGEPQ